MAEVDLRDFPGDEVVLHYGGPTHEIDAFTFSKSLLSFADALQEINRQTQPELEVEIILDAIGPGSFRARVKTKRKSLSGLWKADSLPGAILAAVLAALIYDLIKSDDRRTITVEDHVVIIEQGRDTIIIDRSSWEAKNRLPNRAKVEGHIASAFSVIERDHSVTEFGLAGSLDERHPAAVIPRSEFAILATVSPPEDPHAAAYG